MVLLGVMPNDIILIRLLSLLVLVVWALGAILYIWSFKNEWSFRDHTRNDVDDQDSEMRPWIVSKEKVANTGSRL